MTGDRRDEDTAGDLDAAIDAFRQATALPPEQARTLNARIRAEAGVPDPADLDAYLQRTAATPRRVERVLRRVREGEAPKRARPVYVGILAAAVASVAFVGAVVAAQRDRTPQPTAVGLEPPRLDHVALAFDGEGRIEGTSEAPVIAWTEGRVSVTVVPHHGVKLEVRTDEATVRVVGTRFDVSRAHHGTRVDVSEGVVEVTCAGQPPVPALAGDHVECLPNDLASLVVRVAELTEAGVPADVRMASIDAAVAHLTPADGSAVRAELVAHRVRALEDAGRRDEALAEAEAYLATDQEARRAELATFVARSRYDRDGCAALPDLERAVALGGPVPEQLSLASCLVDRDPVRARALAEQARPRATGDWRTVADHLLDHLRAAP